MGGSRYKLPEPGYLVRSPKTDNVEYVFVSLCSLIICRLYKLTLSDQVQVTVH